MVSESNQENVTFFKRAHGWLKGCLDRVVNAVIHVARAAKKLGQEDPRRVVHSLKVGSSITAVSLLYYFDFLYQGFGVSAMWAVMTVVAVFEFSVGATLGKGVNRGIATLLGGALGVAAHRIASFAGEKVDCIMLGLSVFLIATVVTFMRFFPKLKARYDFALLIFILTFSLMSVSGYRNDEVLAMAQKRLSTILIGGSATILVCTLVCPVWAGADLHKLTAANIEKVGMFLEGFGREYYQIPNDKNPEDQASMDDYKNVLNSKGIEDTLVNFARWEPRHGKFRYRHPWHQYLKIGSLTRQCAYKIDALNSYLRSDVQTPLELRAKIQEPCTRMSTECSQALSELAIGILTMTRSLTADIHILEAKASADELTASLKTGPWPDTDLLDIIPAVTVASLLVDVVSCTEKVADSVRELASLSKFKTPDESVKKHTRLDRVMTRTRSFQGSHNINIIVE